MIEQSKHICLHSCIYLKIRGKKTADVLFCCCSYTLRTKRVHWGSMKNRVLYITF